MDWKLLLQIIGVVLGLLYLYLEYKANIWLWAVGVAMPCVHSILYFKSGLYADFGMEIYYILAGIWGFAVWMKDSRKMQEGENGEPIAAGEKGTSHTGGILPTPRKLWPRLAAVYALCHFGLYFFLRYCTDSTVPFWDAFTTALSIVALWMLSRKYTEQWLVWAVVDAVTVCLYFYKGIPLTACLYILYTVIAVAGYRKWAATESQREQ